MKNKRVINAPVGHAQELLGGIDAVSDSGVIRGWCQSAYRSTRNYRLHLSIDEICDTTVICSESRKDLESANDLEGVFGFTFTLTEKSNLSKSNIRLLDSETGSQLGQIYEKHWRNVVAPKVNSTVAYIDQATQDGHLSGWSWDAADATRRVVLDILANGEPAGETVAMIFRGDLKEANIGDGHYGFEFVLPWRVLEDQTRVVVTLRDHESGLIISQSSVIRKASSAKPLDRITKLEKLVHSLTYDLEQMKLAKHNEQYANEARQLFLAVGNYFIGLSDGSIDPTNPETVLRPLLQQVDHEFPPITLNLPANAKSTLIIINSGTLYELYECIKALHDSGADAHAHIVIVDKCARERSLFITSVVKNVFYTRLTPNDGIRSSISAVKTKYVALLSSYFIAGDEWITSAEDFLTRHPTNALVSPLILDLGKDAATMPSYHFAEDGSFVADGIETADRLGTNISTKLICEVACIIERSALEAVGGFDESYDGDQASIADICLKLGKLGRGASVDTHSVLTRQCDPSRFSITFADYERLRLYDQNIETRAQDDK